MGAIGSVAILSLLRWFPVEAAVQAERQDHLYLALMIMSSFIMAIVTVFLVYSVWKFRARPGDEDRDGDPIHGNTKLEIAWTVIPTVIVVAFAVAAGMVLVKNEERPAGRLIVKVTGAAVRLDVHVSQRAAATSWCCRSTRRPSSTSPRGRPT